MPANLMNANAQPGRLMDVIASRMQTSFGVDRVGAAVSGVRYPWVDIGITGEHLVLAATEFGLATCWIGWIHQRGIRRIAKWGRAIEPAAVITLGYPQDGLASPLPASRRKPMDDLVSWI